MVALGIGSEIDVHELNSMASEPIDTNVILVHNFSSLADVEIKFHVASCNGLYSSVFSVQSRFAETRFAETRFAETRFAETPTLTLTLNPNP